MMRESVFCLAAVMMIAAVGTIRANAQTPRRQVYVSFGQDETVPAGSNDTGSSFVIGDEDIAYLDNLGTADHSDNVAQFVLEDAGDDVLGVSINGDVLYWTVQNFSDFTFRGVTGGQADIFRVTDHGAGTVSLLLDGDTNPYFPDTGWIDGLSVLPDESGVYLSFWGFPKLGTNELRPHNDDVVFFDLTTFEARMVFDYSEENPGLTGGILALHVFSEDRMLVSGIFEDDIWLIEKGPSGQWSRQLWADGETFGFPADSVGMVAVAVVPEPSSLSLVLFGLAVLLPLGLIGRRRGR